MSSNSVIKAGRAMSTMAISHNMTPKVVLSDFAARILPTLSSSQKQQQIKSAESSNRQKTLTKNMFHNNETPLDPCDFGYRVVAPVVQSPLYTSTSFVSTPTEPEDFDCATHSTLGRIICNDDCAAEEVLAAQKEWDTILDMEPTRPHFEFYKEDPYYEFESSSSATESNLFAFIDSHDNEDVLEEAA